MRVTLRVLAWGTLLVATVFLARAEVERSPGPRGAVASVDIIYRRDGDRKVRLDLYEPALPTPPGGWGRGRPAILLIHGGGWRGGDKRACGPIAAALARRGYVVVAVDYFLSRPGAPGWPASVVDLREAVRWLRRHAGEFGVDPARVAAVGMSAGGHLAALLGTLPEGPIEPEGRPSSTPPLPPVPDAVSSRVQAVVNFYGPSDLTELVVHRHHGGGPVATFLGGKPGATTARRRAASPVRHVTPDDPPMLLIHGDDDLLVPLDQSRRLARALDAAGVSHRLIVVEGARHGFGFRVGSRDLLPEICAFLESAWDLRSGTLGGTRPRLRNNARLPVPAVGPQIATNHP